jgi:hypothetical protein
MRKAPNGNPYNRSRNIISQIFDTCHAYNSNWKMGIFDFFVFRWYKNFIEDKKI